MQETTEKSAQTVENRVIELLKEELGEQDISRDTDLIGDLGIDFLDELDLISKLQDQFNIDIDDEEWTKYLRVQRENHLYVKKLAEYIGTKI